jgi:membrane associated rhomboid family serine protease
MRQASVGFHCPDCAGQGRGQVMTGAQIRRRAETPIVTNILIALNVAVFAYELVVGGSLSQFGLSDFGIDYALLGVGTEIPGGLSQAPVLPSGMGGVPVGVAEGEWYRMVTGAFLHGGLFHIAMNMYVLYVLGPQLERALGRLEYLAVYVVAMLAGSAGALLLSPFDPTVGASGAIYGLFGAAVVLQRRLGIDPWRSGIAMLIGINVVLTFAIPGISIGGHLGGLVGGALAAFVVLEATVRRQPIIAAVGCAALALGFALLGIWAAEQALLTLQPVIDIG